MLNVPYVADASVCEVNFDWPASASEIPSWPATLAVSSAIDAANVLDGLVLVMTGMSLVPVMVMVISSLPTPSTE